MTHKAMRSTLGIGHPGTTLWRPQSHGRNRTLLQLSDSACVLLRMGGLWPGLRGLAVRLPFIAFPAGVNAEGVMVFVNARGTRGGATEGQVTEVHPPAAVPRVQRRVRCKAQVLQIRLGLMEPGCQSQGGLRAALGGGPGGGFCGCEGNGLGLGAALGATRCLAGRASSGKSGALGQCVVEGEARGFGTSVQAVSGFAGSAC